MLSSWRPHPPPACFCPDRCFGRAVPCCVHANGTRMHKTYVSLKGAGELSAARRCYSIVNSVKIRLRNVTLTSNSASVFIHASHRPHCTDPLLHLFPPLSVTPRPGRTTLLRPVIDRDTAHTLSRWAMSCLLRMFVHPAPEYRQLRMVIDPPYCFLFIHLPVHCICLCTRVARP